MLRLFYISWLIFTGPSLAAEYEQKQGRAAIRLDADKTEAGEVEIRLSDAMPLTFTVKGEAPLEVQLPETLASPSDWQVTREAAPERIPLAAGRVRWRQTFRLSPRKPGELSLAVAPLRYRSGPDAERWQEITWQPIPVHVRTEIQRADLSELRDVAPPEELPPLPERSSSFSWVV